MIGLAKYNTGKESSFNIIMLRALNGRHRAVAHHFFQTSKQNRQARVLFVCASVRAM